MQGAPWRCPSHVTPPSVWCAPCYLHAALSLGLLLATHLPKFAPVGIVPTIQGPLQALPPESLSDNCSLH